MTNPVDRYIDDVLRHVFATPEDRERLEADLRSHFAEAEADGRTPRDTIAGLGAPDEVAAAFNAEREIQFATFWQRLVAFFGDLGILVTLCLPVAGLALLMGIATGDPGEPSVLWIVIFCLLFLAFAGLFIFYFPLLEERFGRTFGKHLMRIRVLRENGGPISMGQAFVRRLSLYFDLVPLDSLFVLFTDKRQRALDIVAKTIVAREPGQTAPAWAYAVCLLLPVLSILCLVAAVALCAPS